MFGFAENQEKGTYGLGYNLIMTRKTDNAVLTKDIATVIGKFKINAINGYVPHYTQSFDHYRVLMNQIVDKIPTQLRYPERSVIMKEVNTQMFWTFELGTQEGINIPIWIFTVFRQSDGEHIQNLNNDTFCRLPVNSAQCIIRAERHPDSATLINYDEEDYSQGYIQMKEVFRALTKDDILQTIISEDDF